MIALILAAAIAVANPLTNSVGKFSCQEPIRSEWTPFQDDFGNVVYHVDEKIRFKGKVDQTVAVANEFGRLQAVAFLLDQNDEPKKYRHSIRVWRWLNKQFGEPPINDPVWVWPFPDGSLISMGSTGKEIAVVFQCPPPNPESIFR